EIPPVSTCEVTRIPFPPINPVMFYVDPGTFSVTNVTLPRPIRHLLYPGEVIRSVIEEDGDIYVVTTGTGTGKYAKFNELVGPLLFYNVDTTFIAAPWDSEE